MRIIHIGDFHFGNTSFSSKLILNNLYKYFFPILKEDDLIFIPGDIFDANISLNNIDSHYCLEFFLRLFDIAEKKNICIRIIRGTFSHDRNQIASLRSLYKGYTFNFDYFTNLSFEYIKKYNLRIGYLPDDMSFNSSEEIIFTIKKRLSALAWNKVDYIVGHGNFKHAFPFKLKKYPKLTYEISQFKDIVRYYLLFGHVHVPSVTKNMIYCGSFERFKHGEKGKKGFFIIEDHNKITFIENKSSMIYKDFIFKKKDKDYIKSLEDFIKTNFKSNIGFIRFFNSKIDIKQSVISFLNSKYPNIRYSFFKTKIKFIDMKKDIFKVNSNLISPNKENISNILNTFIKTKYNKTLETKTIQNYFDFIQ